MRILMLTELYPPHIGGAEEHVRNLSRGLVDRGHEVSVATAATGDETSVVDEAGIRVHRIGSTTQRISALTSTGRPYLPPFPDPDVVRNLRSIVDAERPEIVHAHGWMVHSFVPLKRNSGARLVVTLHDYGIACAKKSLMYRDLPCTGPGFEKCLRCAGRHYGTAKGMAITIGNWATQRPLRRKVDMFVAVSDAVARGNRLERLGAPYQVIPNFVPDDVASADGAGSTTDAAPAGLPDAPFWLYVGALSPHKGVQLLLDAYKSVAGAPPLVLIGRSSVDEPTAFPPNVVVLRDLPHAAVMSAWRRAALGIVPSLFPDPCPTVALEAMASGVPIIASRTGGLPEIVADRTTGILFPVGDAAGLGGAMREVLEHPDQLAQMSAAARERAPLYMASSVIARLESVYAGLLS